VKSTATTEKEAESAAADSYYSATINTEEANIQEILLTAEVSIYENQLFIFDLV
jgi:hypothetical protein